MFICSTVWVVLAKSIKLPLSSTDIGLHGEKPLVRIIVPRALGDNTITLELHPSLCVRIIPCSLPTSGYSHLQCLGVGMLVLSQSFYRLQATPTLLLPRCRRLHSARHLLMANAEPGPQPRNRSISLSRHHLCSAPSPLRTHKESPFRLLRPPRPLAPSITASPSPVART